MRCIASRVSSNTQDSCRVVVISELPNYDIVIPALLNAGIDKLRVECGLTPGVPLKPMLAKPTKAIGEVLDKFEGKKFTCEYKYDGERAQVYFFLRSNAFSYSLFVRSTNWRMDLSQCSAATLRI